MYAYAAENLQRNWFTGAKHTNTEIRKNCEESV